MAHDRGRARQTAEVVARFSYAQREAAWRTLLTSGHPLLTLAAEVVDEVVGFAWCERSGDAFPAFEVELSAIHLLPAYRGQGVGRKLMSETARNLGEMGFRSLFLWTGTLNGRARAFYEKLGGARVGVERFTGLDGTSFGEVAYGWPDLSLLTVPSAGAGM